MLLLPVLPANALDLPALPAHTQPPLPQHPPWTHPCPPPNQRLRSGRPPQALLLQPKLLLLLLLWLQQSLHGCCAPELHVRVLLPLPLPLLRLHLLLLLRLHQPPPAAAAQQRLRGRRAPELHVRIFLPLPPLLLLLPEHPCLRLLLYLLQCALRSPCLLTLISTVQVCA